MLNVRSAIFAVPLWLSASIGMACTMPEARPSFTDVEPRASFDTAAFANTVSDALGHRFMGYAVTLRDRAGTIVAQINHGYARSPCEAGGEKKFNGRTVSPIGSVSKVLTAATVIHRAENLDSVSLEDPFQDYLPERWRADLHPSLQSVTLRNLLEHRGGFAKSARTLWNHKFSVQERLELGAETYLVAAENIAKNIRLCVPVPRTERCYANTSFALWNTSAASLKPSKWAQIEDGYQPGEISYGSYIRVHIYAQYQDIVRKTLFDPVGVDAGCNVYTSERHRAFTYDGPMAERGINRAEQGRPCAIGGWFMSSRDLSAVVHRIVNTREVINANHHLMFVNGDKRLVFSNRTRVTEGRASSHGGSRWSGAAKAQVVVFPNGYVAAGVMNSKPAEGGPDLRTAIIRGYNAAHAASN